MIKVQEEDFNSIKDDIMPLLEKHYNEVKLFGNIVPLDPNLHLYEMMNMTGNFVFITARLEDNTLIGYMSLFLQQDLHSQKHMIAHTDMCYVAEEHRGKDVFSAMLHATEGGLKELGVSTFTVMFPTQNVPKKMLTELGYLQDQVSFSKCFKEE